MPDLMTNVKTLNSAVRTLLVVGACGVVGYGGWFGYDNYVKPSVQAKQAIADLADLKSQFAETENALKQTAAELEVSETALKQTAAELEVSQELNERLETSMKLLKVDRRIANVTVLEKGKNEDGSPFMEVSFSEVDQDGEQIGAAKNFTLLGEKFYVDGWVASFEDKYIEEADELRAASLFAFKSIYGDAEMPKNAQRLDSDSQDLGPPGIYRDEKKREFEQQIWSDFWKVCNDPYLQQDLGIRAIQGQTSYVQPLEGKTYQINIRASGGMSLKPIEEP
jgi:hypothetical protein